MSINALGNLIWRSDFAGQFELGEVLGVPDGTWSDADLATWQQRLNDAAVVFGQSAPAGPAFAYSAPATVPATGEWQGMNAADLLTFLQDLELTGATDVMQPGFWMMFADMAPAVGPGEEHMTTWELDQRAWSSSLARAVGVSFETYWAEIDLERRNEAASSLEGGNAGGSYFFSLEPSGGPQREWEGRWGRAEREARESNPGASSEMLWAMTRDILAANPHTMGLADSSGSGYSEHGPKHTAAYMNQIFALAQSGDGQLSGGQIGDLRQMLQSGMVSINRAGTGPADSGAATQENVIVVKGKRWQLSWNAKAADAIQLAQTGGGGASGAWGPRPEQAEATRQRLLQLYSPYLDQAAKERTTETENGYSFTKDGLGRTVEISGQLKLESGTRDQDAQDAARSNGVSGDHGGHYIGRRFGGPGDQKNLFPQNSNFNLSAYRTLENEWARALGNGSSVFVRIQPIYPNSQTLRPSALSVQFTIDGATTRLTLPNQSGGR